MLEYLWDQDAWIVRQKTKIVLGIFALFFISMVMSCQEMRYMISGKVVDAAMNSHVQTEVRDGEKVTYRVVGYSYVDGGVLRQRYVDVALDWPGATKETVKVQYIPGRDQSRFEGETNRIWVVIFVGSLAALVAGMIFIAKTG